MAQASSKGGRTERPRQGMSGHPGKTPWDEPVIRSPLQVDPVVRSLLRADPVERGHFYTFLANSDLVVQIVLQVDLVGDDSHSQARPRLRGKETARGAVLDEEEIEERRRKGGIWRPAVTPWAPCVVGDVAPV